jgi:hypothetical protein
MVAALTIVSSQIRYRINYRVWTCRKQNDALCKIRSFQYQEWWRESIADPVLMPIRELILSGSSIKRSDQGWTLTLKVDRVTYSAAHPQWPQGHCNRIECPSIKHFLELTTELRDRPAGINNRTYGSELEKK